MKRLLILAVWSSSLAVWATPRLELEVGGGPILQTDFAPSLSARVGVDFRFGLIFLPVRISKILRGPSHGGINP